MASAELVSHCLELLSPLGQVRARRMFGGWGLYAGEVFVALIAEQRLYLKVDDDTREAFARAGCVPFVYTGQGKPVTMSYWTVPDDAMDSPALMTPWARLALQAALAARSKKGATKAVTKRPARTAARRP
jgi:DNA transformation protein